MTDAPSRKRKRRTTHPRRLRFRLGKRARLTLFRQFLEQLRKGVAGDLAAQDEVAALAGHADGIDDVERWGELWLGFDTFLDHHARGGEGDAGELGHLIRGFL